MVTGQLSANQPAAGAGPKPLSRLERVALEIVETEQAYVRDLKSIVEDYLGCIIDCGEVPLKPEQVSALFCNIEDIYEFNSDLLEDLERSPDAAAIADCFVERSEAFDIYTLYCMNYPNSVAVLRDCMQDEVLVKFFHQRQSSLNHSLPLETYLLKPVQRILKYHLLLQELSKHLSKSDPGYEVVEDAIVAMTAVAWYINDMKRKQEHAVRLQEIEALLVNWSGPDLSGFGELVLEGSFRVHRVKKERAFFLFDRMLLIAKKRLEHFVYSSHIFCCNLLLVETLKDPLSFKISDQTIPKQQHIVQTRNQEEKRLWVHYLKRLIVENHPASLPQKARQVLGDNFCQTPQFQQEALKSCSNPRLDDIHNFHRGRRPSEPQELLFTPEKSRKSLPLLLEGNLPYRRSRRQSAPAKDIEAAFHSPSLKSAESEGQLCSLDSGSCSTLASSVIEVEPELSQDSANPDLSRDQKDQDQQEPDEEELVTPPTSLSITEEILQLLNQSRRDEAGVKEQEPPPEQNKHGRSNFTCPLPPIISPCSPEPLPTMQQEAPPTTQQDAPPTPVQESLPTMQLEQSEETPQEQDGDRENSDADILVENEPVFEEPETEMSHETVPDGVDDKNKQEITTFEAESEPEIPKTANDEVVESVESRVNEDSAVQRRPCPTRGSQRRKRDKNIIEKIRSYYEAAAEAEEDGETTGEEEGLSEADEDDEERPRSSVSKIPSGFVRDSISRFSSNEEKTADIGESGEADVDKRNAREVCPEIGDVFEEKQEDEDQVTSVRNVEVKHASGEVEVCQNQAKDDEQTKGDDAEELKSVKAVCGPKVGRWSRHSRIVSANRALFEGMASDVARIGLFEADPRVADPVLLENSERILNKVQTLARMYSEKASHVKAQHQRRAMFSQSWSSAARGGGQSQGGGVKAANQVAQTKDRQRTDPPVSDSTDPVTPAEPLSSNGGSPPRSRDAPRGSRPEGGLGPGLTQDRSSVWGHNSSDCGLRSCTEPGQSSLSRREDLPFTSVASSAKNKNRLPEIPPALFPAAKKLSHNPEESAKVAKDNLLEETGFRQTHPATSRELSQSKTLSSGYGGPDAPLWESGGLTQKHELLQLSQHENTPHDGAGASGFHNNKEEKARMGLLVQSPQEQLDTTTKSVEKMPIDAVVKEESPTAKHQTSEVTGRQAYSDAPFLGYQSPDIPLRSSAEELPQNCAPNLGHTSRDEINDQPSTFKVPHPGFTEVHAPAAAPYLGNQSGEVPLSDSGGPGVSTSPLPSSTSAASVDEGRGLSAQSPVWPKEQLPTFTNQRPAHLQGVKSYVPNVHESVITTTNNTTVHKLHEQRLQSTVGPNPRPWSRPGLDSPALAALLPSPALSSISAFKPDLHHRSPSPVPKPTDLHHRSPSPAPKPADLHHRSPSPVPKPSDLHQRSPSPVPKPPDLHRRCPSPIANPSLVPNPAENHPHQGPQRPSNLGLRSARPSPASAFTRSLAASCISQSISQSMSKRTQFSDKSSTPAPLPSTHHLRQRSPSPKSSVETNQHPKSFLWSPQSLASRPQRQTAGPGHANANNSNNVNIGFSSPHAANWASDEATLDSTWTNSHNRVARPFCASEPNSRVQSPTSFSHDVSSPLANKPPNPRRPGSAHNPLGLTLDINRASAMSYSSSLSPRIMSPPPIGVSVNAWSNHVAMPQPLNARFTPSPTSMYPTSLRNSRNASPSPPFSPTPRSPLRRSHSTTLADRAPSPARSNPNAARRSWVETSRRSMTFNGPFDQHEAGFYRSGYTSPALACLSPRTALQSPVSPSRFSPARSTFSGQQFAGVPWSDEITRSFANDFNTSLHPQETQSWTDPELDEGTCRSQIICAYVSRPPRPPSHPNLLQNQSYSPAPPSPAKPANQRTSYATTVNLQIAGSGRIKAFSTAQVSLTQTLQNGAQTQGALARRVSVHGLPQ